MIAVIDNYDSFTWNLVDLLRRSGEQIAVYRNDALSAAELLALSPKGILISPGPGRPVDSGICPAVLQLAAGRLPILGICLGHQLIGEHFGMVLGTGVTPVHGKTSMITHDGRGLFAGIPNPFQAMRYHSLILEAEPLSTELEVTAWTDLGEVMGVRHRRWPIEGLQFHPESILSPAGAQLVANWVQGL
jgi:anthranilate synthase/aminodeoxychorismate synthase-like glutamine amidotransferase